MTVTNPVEKMLDKLADRIGEEGARVRAVVEAGLVQTVNGLRVNAARPAPILANALNSTATGRLVGWSIANTGGAAVTVTVYNGRDPGSSDPLAVIPIAAGAGSTHLPGGAGVSFGDGLYVAATGPVTGALYFGAHD